MGVTSNLSPTSPIKFPCSAYSLPAQLIDKVGYWDVDASSVGEDMHMTLKCFFATQGHLKITTIYSPASVCNVQENSYYQGLVGRYTQAKRHMWASLDTGYAICRLIFGIIAPGYDSPTDFVINTVPILVPDSVNKEDISKFMLLLPTVMYRLFEAHTMMSQVIIMNLLSAILNRWSDSPYVAFTAWVGVRAGFIGVSMTIFSFYFYEKYHQWASVDRWNLSMNEELIPGSGQGVQRLGKRSVLKSPRNWYTVLDYLLLPVSGLFYLALPQFHAHFLHLFSVHLDYTVAAKPIMNLTSTDEQVSISVNEENSDHCTIDVEAATKAVSRGDSGFYEYDGKGNSLSWVRLDTGYGQKLSAGNGKRGVGIERTNSNITLSNEV